MRNQIFINWVLKVLASSSHPSHLLNSWVVYMCWLFLQKYLQSTTVRVEEMRIKRRDAELWMSHRMLPDFLKERIRRYEQYKWQENRGVEEETLIRNLPKDLRRDIKRHLCIDLLKKVCITHNHLSIHLVFFLLDKT